MNLKFNFALFCLVHCSTGNFTFPSENKTFFKIGSLEEETTSKEQARAKEVSPHDEKSELLNFINCCAHIPTGPNSSVVSKNAYGGIPTKFGEFPSLALLHYVDSDGRSNFPCAGTLINKRYLLTAAHCVVGTVLEKYGTLTSIRLGEHDWSKTICNGGSCNNQVIERRIESIVPHQLYSPDHKMHDIALVRFSEPLEFFRSHIKPICLQWLNPYIGSRLWTGHTFTVVGWGRTLQVKQSPISNKLQIPYYDHEDCKNRYARLRYHINDQQICAGGEFKKDTCDGDSGGPLISTVNECDYLDGIVSYGKGCGLENWPGVYTNVTAYRDWIVENLEP